MYQTPKFRQSMDRDDQRQRVNQMVTSMATKFSAKPRVRTVWNECLQRYVEMR